MIQAVSLLFGLIAIALSFHSAVWGWLFLLLFAVLLLFVFMGLKNRKMEKKPILSGAAKTLFEKCEHYYAMPHASRDLGRSAIILHLCGIVAAIVGALHGFGAGLLLGAAYFVALAILAKAFDPNNFCYDAQEKALLEEIILAISGEQSAPIPPRRPQKKRPASPN